MYLINTLTPLSGARGSVSFYRLLRPSTLLIHFLPTPLGKGVDLRGSQRICKAFAVHRLPGGQQQDELAGHARLATRQALAEPEFRRDHLPGLAGAVRQHPDDAGGGGGCHVVLGARERRNQHSLSDNAE